MQKIHSGTLALLVVASMFPCGRTEADTRGYRNDLVSFGLIVAIDPATGADAVPPEHAMCNFQPPNVVFSAGFVTGWAYGGDTLYMVQSGPPDALGFLDTSVVGCGSRIAIGTNTGFGGLEALAYCAADGMLYSQTFAGHDGQLVRIDPVSGVGTLVGSAMQTDLRITGMDCDAAGELWAITGVFDTRPSELYRVNRSTGVATLVGPTGLGVDAAQSLAIDRSAPGFALLAAGATLYSVDPGTGAAATTGGSLDTVWALATKVPEPGAAANGLVSALALALLTRANTRRGRGPAAR